jgi:CheY-like chemotaxis protein
MTSTENEIEILLVEDNACDAALAIRALKRHHLATKLVHVKDGAEALEFLFGTGLYAGRDVNQLPKVILLDLKLPKVDGLEVLRAIKSNAQSKCIPVVVLTSSHEQRDIVDSYRFGVNSYIVKPVEFDNFSSAVADVGCY